MALRAKTLEASKVSTTEALDNVIIATGRTDHSVKPGRTQRASLANQDTDRVGLWEADHLKLPGNTILDPQVPQRRAKKLDREKSARMGVIPPLIQLDGEDTQPVSVRATVF